jgi:carboxypeptidase T
MKKGLVFAVIVLFCCLPFASVLSAGVFSLQQQMSDSEGSTSLSIDDVRTARLNDFSNGVPTESAYGVYHTYQEMTELFQQLAENHSDIMSLESRGKTYQGRDLWMVKLSDNVGVDEDEPEVLLMGVHHGNEKPSYEVLIYFIQYMVESYAKPNTDDDLDGQVNEDPIDGVDNDHDGLIDEDPSEDRVREVLNNTEIYLIPMVNPDGVEAGTRKNCVPNHGYFGLRPMETSVGVDLNRNYGYKWFLFFLFYPRLSQATQFRDRSDVYRGPYSFSENETQAVKTLAEEHDFSICLTYHTYGELVLYPWGYTSRAPPDKPVFVSIGENITAINGYTLDQSIGLYPTLGDATDWLYGVHGVLAYTIELGLSYAPQDPDVVHQMCVIHTGVNLYVCERAE